MNTYSLRLRASETGQVASGARLSSALEQDVLKAFRVRLRGFPVVQNDLFWPWPTLPPNPPPRPAQPRGSSLTMRSWPRIALCAAALVPFLLEHHWQPPQRVEQVEEGLEIDISDRRLNLGWASESSFRAVDLALARRM